MAYRVAVIGATGLVGSAIIDVLQERNFPIAELYPVASQNSAGKKLAFGDDFVTVQDLAKFDFRGIDFCFFSAGRAISALYVPQAIAHGSWVIDNTSEFRYHEDIPLIVPEVNYEVLKSYQHKVIANPNCSTIQLAVALKPLHDLLEIKRVWVATYQAVSGAGARGLHELLSQSSNHLSDNKAALAGDVFTQPIAFNVIPHIDKWQENGYSREEMKINWELKKILDPKIKVSATAVRVPVLTGHSAAVTIEAKHHIELDKIQAALEQAPGVKVINDIHNNLYPTPLVHGENEDFVYVGRIRHDLAFDNGLTFWVVANNVRKGGALNSVQIAEHLL